MLILAREHIGGNSPKHFIQQTLIVWGTLNSIWQVFQ